MRNCLKTLRFNHTIEHHAHVKRVREADRQEVKCRYFQDLLTSEKYNSQGRTAESLLMLQREEWGPG